MGHLCTYPTWYPVSTRRKEITPPPGPPQHWFPHHLSHKVLGQWELGNVCSLGCSRGSWQGNVGGTYRDVVLYIITPFPTFQLRSQNEETGQSEGPNASSANERLPTVKPFSHWRILGHGSDQWKAAPSTF